MGLGVKMLIQYSLCVVNLICSFHVSFESMVTPKYLALCTAFISTSLIWYEKLIVDFLFVITKNSHLETGYNH